MSKAIYGHMGGRDAVLVAEVARLRRRVRALEEQVLALEAELVSVPDTVDLGALDLGTALRELPDGEPALT
jgi:DNA invertase Pin-like site-specific DNA recombinase